MMREDYNKEKFKLNLYGEFLLQRHLRLGKVDIDYVIPVHIIFVFLLNCVTIYYTFLLSWIVGLTFLLWSVFGIVFLQKHFIPTTTLKYILVSLPITIIMVISGHMTNCLYWLYYKIFKENNNE